MKKISKATMKTKTMVLAVAMAAGMGLTQQANAVLPTYDAATHSAATATAVGVAASILLDEWRNKSNGNHYENTENYYESFENHFTKIEGDITNISEHTENIQNHTENISNHTENIKTYTKTLYDHSVTNNYYYGGDDGVDPIPFDELVAGIDPGPMNDYLTKFNDTAGYKGAACFSASCSEGDIADLQVHQAYGVDAQIKSNDAMLKTLQFQRDGLKADGERLAKLNEKAWEDPEKTGQRKQMQLALQLANEQGGHLLKLREAMLQSQSAEVVREKVANDMKAKQVASSQNLRRPVSFDNAVASSGF